MVLVSQRKNQAEYLQYRSSLFSDQVKFFTDVIALLHEKKGGKHQSCSIDFRNHVEFKQETPTFTAGQIGKTIVIVCPAFFLTVKSY